MQLPEFVLRFRDRMVARPDFRRWAGRFWATRGMSRNRAASLFDLAAGFVYSQILLACVQLDLFAILAEGPQPLSRLAERLNLSPRAAEQLLEAAAALGLAQHRQGGFGLGPLGGPMVGNVAIAEMVRHHAMLYADMADPLAMLRGEGGGGALGRFWGYADGGRRPGLGSDDTAPYSALMAASQPLVAAEILDAYDLSRHKCLMDVGGGAGAFLQSAGERHPVLRLMLFDLPPVVVLARARLDAAGMGTRADLHGGDFHADSLPMGADVISFVRVIHDHDDDLAQSLLTKARAALPAGGSLLLAEPMAGTVGAEAMGAAYFNFYLHAMGSGRARRPEVLMAMLLRAGFGQARMLPTATPLQTQLIHAIAE
jgi:demethylspheroidene O-methyltransferase